MNALRRRRCTMRCRYSRDLSRCCVELDVCSTLCQRQHTAITYRLAPAMTLIFCNMLPLRIAPLACFDDMTTARCSMRLLVCGVKPAGGGMAGARARAARAR